MNFKRYRALQELVRMIDSPNKEKCDEFLANNWDLISKAKGSSTKHQAWEGGYLDHIVETMNISVVLYDTFDELRKLPFKKSDSLLVLFLHDIEKPWKQITRQNNELALYKADGTKDRERIEEFKYELIEDYGFKLTKEHKTALKYVEGEIDDYSPIKRNTNELGAFCHLCDYWSARGWYDYPKKDIFGW